MKFTHVIIGKKIPEHIKNCLEEQPARSGMYNWIFAHKGEINTFWDVIDRVDDFDQIQVNMSPVDFPMIAELRRKLNNSSTKLILNNDYVCECWQDWTIDPLRYDQMQRMGDMVFGTEPHQVSNMIDGAFCIPHPTNTEVLKKLGTTKKRDSVGYIYHWWAPQTYLGSRTLEKVKKQFNIKKSSIYGYTKPEKDRMAQWNGVMFNENVGMVRFPEFAQTIQQEKVVYDPNPYHTYGRNGVELACFKVPVVGSNRVFSYNKLMPELTCDPFDTKVTLERFKTALNEESVQPILDKAYKEVEYFSYKNSVKRWNEACEIAFERGGHEWYEKQ
jgi:hypothetical protein